MLGLTPFLLCLALASAGGDNAAPPQKVPFPTVSFGAPELDADYAKAISALEDAHYSEAKKVLRRLRERTTTDAQKEAVERCLLEADGGFEVEKITTLAKKRRLRLALVHIAKVEKKYEGTRAGQALAELRKACFDELYFVVADFEKTDAKKDDPAGKDGQDGGDARGGRNGEDGGYGLNTHIVKGTPKDGNVRSGHGALEWRTGRMASSIQFREVRDHVAAYRYLDISIRTEDPNERPQLMFIFDCLEGGLGGGGPRRGVGRAFNREGFHTTILPTGSWQDLRIDLHKLTRKGDVKWDDVVTLRIVHAPGVSATILIDDVRLEKE